MHPNLNFTKKLEIHRALPFLDMLATRAKSRLQTSWYCKPTDTGLSFSYYAVATSEYNWNIAEGTIHRIHHATSTWEAFNGGLEKATADWEANHYPPSFYSPIVRATVEKLLETRVNTLEQKAACKTERSAVVLQYRGPVSDEFCEHLRLATGVPVIFTTSKLKSCLSTLKCPIP